MGTVEKRMQSPSCEPATLLAQRTSRDEKVAKIAPRQNCCRNVWWWNKPLAGSHVSQGLRELFADRNQFGVHALARHPRIILVRRHEMQLLIKCSAGFREQFTMNSTKRNQVPAKIIIAAFAMILTPHLVPAQEKAVSPRPDSADAVYDSNEVDRMPVSIGIQKTPRMPFELKQQGLGGWVGVQIIVGKKGNVEKAGAAYWSDKLAVAASIEAVSQWQFKPAMKNGVPVKCLMLIPIQFNISGITWKEAPVSGNAFDRNPMPIGPKAYPNFPSKLLSKPNEATVNFLAGADGKVSQIKTVSSTDTAFSETMEKTVSSWRYIPAMKDGKAVSCPMSLTFKTTQKK